MYSGVVNRVSGTEWVVYRVVSEYSRVVNRVSGTGWVGSIDSIPGDKKFGVLIN